MTLPGYFAEHSLPGSGAYSLRRLGESMHHEDNVVVPQWWVTDWLYDKLSNNAVRSAVCTASAGAGSLACVEGGPKAVGACFAGLYAVCMS
jgi:hypothetical protein